MSGSRLYAGVRGSSYQTSILLCILYCTWIACILIAWILLLLLACLVFFVVSPLLSSISESLKDEDRYLISTLQVCKALDRSV